MIENLKIYVPTLNEERIIQYTLKPLITVFPGQVEVIDLGSIDSTLEKIQELGKIPVNREPIPNENPGAWYTQLLNSYSQKQPWVMWVDGDEVWPISALLKVKKLNFTKNSKTFRGFCRILKEEPDGLYYSKEFLSMGVKIFHSEYRQYRRSWPQEILVPTNPGYPPDTHKAMFTGLWFWHGVLLNRSLAEEGPVRYSKRIEKQKQYDENLTWIKFDKESWEENFNSVEVKDWKVKDVWSGLIIGNSDCTCGASGYIE